MTCRSRVEASTIISNDNSDNRMTRREFVQNHNDQLNEPNWWKKLSLLNYPRLTDKNPALLARHAASTSTNWINIRRVKSERANRHLQPTHSTHPATEHTPTNLNVQFEWNSRIYFSVSPEIQSR